MTSGVMSLNVSMFLLTVQDILARLFGEDLTMKQRKHVNIEQEDLFLTKITFFF